MSGAMKRGKGKYWIGEGEEEGKEKETNLG